MDTTESNKNTQSSTNCFSTDSILHLHKLLESQKEILPFDLLGRSLAYNPYPPRFLEIFPTLHRDCKQDLKPCKALYIQSFNFTDLATIAAQNSKIIVLDIARDKNANPLREGLECIGYLRHYTDSLIIVRDCFMEHYQILQALVYGADALLFNRFCPKGALGQNVDFASHLGLVSLLESITLRDIKDGIFAKVSGFYLPSECFSELISIIPKRKIICADVSCVKNQDRGKHNVDFGVDFVLQDFVL